MSHTISVQSTCLWLLDTDASTRLLCRCPLPTVNCRVSHPNQLSVSLQAMQLTQGPGRPAVGTPALACCCLSCTHSAPPGHPTAQQHLHTAHRTHHQGQQQRQDVRSNALLQAYMFTIDTCSCAPQLLCCAGCRCRACRHHINPIC